MGFWDNAAKGFSSGWEMSQQAYRDDESKRRWEAENSRAQESHDLSQARAKLQYNQEMLSQMVPVMADAFKAGDTKKVIDMLNYSRGFTPGATQGEIIWKGDTPDAFEGVQGELAYRDASGKVIPFTGSITDELSKGIGTVANLANPQIYWDQVKKIGEENLKQRMKPEIIAGPDGNPTHVRVKQWNPITQREDVILKSMDEWNKTQGGLTLDQMNDSLAVKGRALGNRSQELSNQYAEETLPDRVGATRAGAVSAGVKSRIDVSGEQSEIEKNQDAARAVKAQADIAEAGIAPARAKSEFYEQNPYTPTHEQTAGLRYGQFMQTPQGLVKVDTLRNEWARLRESNPKMAGTFEQYAKSVGATPLAGGMPGSSEASPSTAGGMSQFGMTGSGKGTGANGQVSTGKKRGKIDEGTALQYLKKFGDKDAARKAAQADGWEF